MVFVEKTLQELVSHLVATGCGAADRTKRRKREKNVAYEANGVHVAETRHADRVAASDDGLVSDEEPSGEPSIRGGCALMMPLFVFLARADREVQSGLVQEEVVQLSRPQPGRPPSLQPLPPALPSSLLRLTSISFFLADGRSPVLKGGHVRSCAPIRILHRSKEKQTASRERFFQLDFPSVYVGGCFSGGAESSE